MRYTFNPATRQITNNVDLIKPIEFDKEVFFDEYLRIALALDNIKLSDKAFELLKYIIMGDDKISYFMGANAVKAQQDLGYPYSTYKNLKEELLKYNFISKTIKIRGHYGLSPSLRKLKGFINDLIEKKIEGIDIVIKFDLNETEN